MRLVLAVTTRKGSQPPVFGTQKETQKKERESFTTQIGKHERRGRERERERERREQGNEKERENEHYTQHIQKTA